MTETMKDAQAIAFDGVQPEIRNEPCAFKRACFRAGYDAGRSEAVTDWPAEHGILAVVMMDMAAKLCEDFGRDAEKMGWECPADPHKAQREAGDHMAKAIRALFSDDARAALAAYSRNRPEVVALVAALKELVALPENTSPFGGEMQEDRIERTFDRARAALAEMEKDHGHD